MTKADQILSYARQHIGKPYRLGSAGPDLWDCSGLTKMAVRSLGYKWYHGATTQWTRGHSPGDPALYGYWSASGTIDTLPLNKVAFLFNQDRAQTSKLVMAHTGIYDGRGNVVQAGGQYPGVSDRPINKKRWSHWATLKGVDDSMAGLTLGSSGAEVRTAQQALINLGYDLGAYGVDGKYGAITAKAVKAFQTANGLPSTGMWGDAEQAKANALGQQPPSVDKAALIAEARGMLKRLGAILDNL